MTAKRENAAIVGAGVAACAVCCAGPILGFLAAIGLTPVVGALVFGVTGLAIAAAMTLLLVRRRGRQRTVGCSGTSQPSVVSLGMPSVRQGS